MFHVLDGRDGRLRGGIHGDDDGADDAIETAYFAHETQAFLEEDSRKDGGDDNGKGTKGCH